MYALYTAYSSAVVEWNVLILLQLVSTSSYLINFSFQDTST